MHWVRGFWFGFSNNFAIVWQRERVNLEEQLATRLVKHVVCHTHLLFNEQEGRLMYVKVEPPTTPRDAMLSPCRDSVKPFKKLTAASRVLEII